MAEYTSTNIKYFSIRKNVAGAKLYDIKVKLKPNFDHQIGFTSDQLIGKDITYGERTQDGGGEFKCTIRATGDGKGGYISIKTLKSLLKYKGQLVLLSLDEMDYSGTYIVTHANTTILRGNVHKGSSGTVIEGASLYDVDVTFQKVADQSVTFPTNNASKTPTAVKKNDATKKGISNLSVEYQKYYNDCPTLSFSTYKNKRGVKCVSTTQTLLQKNKYYLSCKVDGWFYTCTRSAVIAFKKKHKIEPYNSTVNKTVRKALLQILTK